MESTTNAVEDQLIDGLQFRLTAGASYNTDRNNVSFFPTAERIIDLVL